MDNERKCWLCGANGSGDPLDRHHIFQGKNRQLSERYGLVVYLCHAECHIFGPNAVHKNPYPRRRLQEWGQRKAMEEQGWTAEKFRGHFGRNYIMEENADA